MRHPRRAGVAAAYAHKLKTGRGQLVDTSLLEAALQQTYWHAAIHFATGESPGPSGSAHPLTAPYQAFHASDGWINIGGANQPNWERITDVLGHPEWRDDPRFATNSARMANLAALTSLMDAVLATRTRGRVDRALRCRRRARGPGNSIGEALAHPQALARGMVVDLVHPQAGPTKALGCPIHFSATPTRSPARRRSWASTRARCCASTATRTPTSMRSLPAGVVEDASDTGAGMTMTFLTE